MALFHPHQEKYRETIIKYGIGIQTSSIALNVLATTLIAGRLLHQRKLIRVVNTAHSREYLTLVAVFAESGALYTITGLIHIPLQATEHPLSIMFASFFTASAVSRFLFF